jgi:phosphate-selective porin OprO/OprP
MGFKLKNICVLVASTLVLATANTAMADSTDDIVNALIHKGVLTEEEGALLYKGHTGEKEMAEKNKRSNPTMEVGAKGLVLKSPDGDFSMKLGGRMHADFIKHSGDKDSQATDGSEIRRGRIALSGTMYKDFDYIIETDFAKDGVSVKDLFLSYHGFNTALPLELTMGHQKHGVSMEIQESSNDIMFTERSLVAGLTVPFFDRAIGLNLKTHGEDWHVEGGFYGDSMATGAKGKDEGNGFGVRGTYSFLNEKDRVFHVGGSYGYRKISQDGLANSKTAEFKAATSNFSGLTLVGGTMANLDTVNTGIVETAAMFGPLSFQAEYAMTTAGRTGGLQDIDLSAWYAQVGYTLTGESRSYKGSDGEFKRLKPKQNFSFKNGTWGAWEVAARLDQADFQDADFQKGNAKRASLSLNLYANETVRFLMGYTKMYDLSGGAHKHVDGSYADDIDVYTFRTQFAF